MSGEFDSRKDSQSTKFERKSRIFVKLSFRELYRDIAKILETCYFGSFGQWL